MFEMCAIAACDSLLVKEHGVKSAHGDHRFIVKMMEWAFKDKSRDILGDLGNLMEKKSVIQYDAVLVDKKAAEEAVEKADRVFRFVSDMIG
jgi:tRNA A58 N-methylase Trm61